MEKSQKSIVLYKNEVAKTIGMLHNTEEIALFNDERSVQEEISGVKPDVTSVIAYCNDGQTNIYKVVLGRQNMTLDQRGVQNALEAAMPSFMQQATNDEYEFEFMNVILNFMDHDNIVRKVRVEIIQR